MIEIVVLMAQSVYRLVQIIMFGTGSLLIYTPHPLPTLNNLDPFDKQIKKKVTSYKCGCMTVKNRFEFRST